MEIVASAETANFKRTEGMSVTEKPDSKAVYRH